MRAPGNPVTPVPTAKEIKAIQCLAERAGGAEELKHWIGIACPSRRRGRPKGATPFADFDDRVLSVAEMLHLETKLPIHSIVKKIATDQNPKGRLRWTPGRGARPQAMIKRILAKERKDRIAFANMSKTEIDLTLQKFVDWVKTLDEDSASFKWACRIAMHLPRAE